MTQKILTALIAEFIGTFALVFIGVGSIAADHLTGGQVGLVGIALAHGLTIAVMVSATIPISGGHLNPAVTISLLTARKINLRNAGRYIVAQCLGALTAAFLVKWAFPEETLTAVAMGTPMLGSGITVQMGLITETILTFFLVFVIYATAVEQKGLPVAGLLIGLTVTLDILMGGPVTGAAMNPARHLGPALLGGGFPSYGWIYWVGPIVGGVLAATCYQEQIKNKKE